MAVPQELHESMARTIGYAVDYVLDTLDFSPEVTAAPLSEEMLWKQPSGDPMMMKDQFCVVLWNDDKHSFAEVIQLLQDLTGRTREEASEVANKIDEQGRDIIEMNSNIPRLLDIGQTISQIELGVTVRRAYDTFREQVSAVIIEWLLDLVRCCLGSDQIILREIIAAELLSPRRQTYPRGFTDSSPIVADVSDPARIDWLLLYHTKLWKKPRLDLKEVYASLITLSHAHKLAIGKLRSTMPPATLIVSQPRILRMFTAESLMHICSLIGRLRRLSNISLCSYSQSRPFLSTWSDTRTSYHDCSQSSLHSLRTKYKTIG